MSDEFTNDGEDGVKRVSISLLPDVLESLHQIIERRGFKSRSQAISEMISHDTMSSWNHSRNELVAGTITLVYDDSRPGLLENLSRIQRENINEVLSSQHVLLEHKHTMEVLLVQGPAKTLREIADELITCKGVRTGSLALSSIILPPIHPLPNNETTDGQKNTV